MRERRTATSVDELLDTRESKEIAHAESMKLV
jgi:hypothetical protein